MLVEAEGSVGGVTEDAVSRPAGEADFADELGFDPGRGLGGFRGDVQRAGPDLERAQPFPEVTQGLVVEAGADLTAVDQAVAVEDSEDEGADLVGAAAAAGCVADDHA